MIDLLSRRNVIKTILVTTATSLIGNKAWAARTISDVAASPPGIDPNLGLAKVTLSSFPALASDGGSIRLGSSNIQSQSVGPVGLYYPLLINRISATEYVTLDSQCTHAGFVVAKCIGGLAGTMTCPGHGSKFDIRGQVLPGFDAQFDLLSYTTMVSDGILTIELPDVGYTITQTSVLNGTQKRLQLTWPSVSSTEYEVRWRPNLETAPTVVSFFTTLTGTTAVTSVTSPFSGGNRSVYVIPQDGIYQVAIRMRAV
jgi:Rieske Fe-S protein